MDHQHEYKNDDFDRQTTFKQTCFKVIKHIFFPKIDHTASRIDNYVVVFVLSYFFFLFSIYYI